MKIYNSIEEYSKDNYNSKNLYIIKNEKIYFKSGSKIYESRNLFLIKNTHEKCKLCKYFSICENVINKQSLQSTGHTSAIIFNDYCEFEEEYK